MAHGSWLMIDDYFFISMIRISTDTRNKSPSFYIRASVLKIRVVCPILKKQPVYSKSCMFE